MTEITLPDDFEVWAKVEVAAGRAESVEALALTLLSRHRDDVDALRASLDDAEAEADRDGWLSEEEVFGKIETKLEERIAFEAEWEARRSKSA